MKFNITTLGCKVNSYESEALISDLESKGMQYIDNNTEDVDVCIINTCTVTSMSDQKSRQVIRGAKRKHPNAIIVAMGCYVQMNHNEALQLADIIIGTQNRLNTFELIKSYIQTKNEINQAIDAVTDVNAKCEFEEMHLDRLSIHTRGFIKIQDGCENFCSYCAIPYARGKIRSRHPDSIINEINRLVDEGTKEIIISGINTGCYGQDLGYINLAKLITRIMEETSIYRIRVSSIELMEVTDELLETYQKYESRIAKHMHIPLQGGSDGVLIRMHRKYLSDDYRKLINRIRTLFPDIAITTDFLAGFVGETEEEFKEAKDFIHEMKFASMHIFPYSRRKGTEADLMNGHLPDNVKTNRASELLNIAKELKEQYEKQFIGRTMDVIVEAKKKGLWHGHTSNYLDVFFTSDETDLINRIMIVKIVKIENDTIYGKLQGEQDERI